MDHQSSRPISVLHKIAFFLLCNRHCCCFKFAIKGAVSRNSAKLANYKMPVKSKRNIKITT